MTTSGRQRCAHTKPCAWCGDGLAVSDAELEDCLQCGECASVFHDDCRAESVSCPICTSPAPCLPIDHAAAYRRHELVLSSTGRVDVSDTSFGFRAVAASAGVAALIVTGSVAARYANASDAHKDKERSEPIKSALGLDVGEGDVELNQGESGGQGERRTAGNETPDADGPVVAPPDEWTLARAVNSGSIIETKDALEAGIPVTSLRDTVPNVEHQLLAAGEYALLKLLLDHGVDVDATSGPLDETLLHTAVRLGELEAVRLLIERGARLNARNRDGQTILHIALAEQHSGVAVLLIHRVANDAPAVLGMSDDLGQYTPLHLAALNGLDLELEKLLGALVRTGGDLSPKTSIGHNPLHCAVMNERESVVAVQVLCRVYAEHSPHLLAANYFDGTSPREVAESLDRTEMVRELDSYR